MKRSRHLIYIAPALVVCLCISVACRHKLDAEMIGHFRQNAQAFEQIVLAVNRDVGLGRIPPTFILRHGVNEVGQGLPPNQVKEYRALLDRCCPKCDLFRNSSSGTIFFTASSFGILLKGSYKGYAYAPTRPGSVFSSLNSERVIPADCKFHFRPITGKWYLYYQNCA